MFFPIWVGKIDVFSDVGFDFCAQNKLLWRVHELVKVVEKAICGILIKI